MSAISDEIHGAIQQLHTSYKVLVWYKKIFFPKVVRKALETYDGGDATSQQVAVICDAVLNRTWWFQRAFFSSLIAFSKSMIADFSASSVDKKEASSELGKAIERLHRFDLLNRNIAVELARHQSPETYATDLIRAYVVKVLFRFRLFKNNRPAVLEYKNIDDLADILKICSKNELFTNEEAQANFELLMRHDDLKSLGSALKGLSYAGLLDNDLAQNNFIIAATHANLLSLGRILLLLIFTDVWENEKAQANFGSIVNSKNLDVSLRYLIELYQKGSLTGESAPINFEAFLANPAPLDAKKQNQPSSSFSWDFFQSPKPESSLSSSSSSFDYNIVTS